jgi:predicted dehydrogenase
MPRKDSPNVQARATRRGFLKSSLAAGAACSLLPRLARSASPNEKVVVGIVGIRGRGYALMMGFATRPGSEVAYLADVDTRLFTTVSKSSYVYQFAPELRGPRIEGVTKAQGRRPQTVQDFRRILDDKAVDAIAVATPDHWHALATIWACQAGKDVYVEKPVSYNPWEGRKMVEAARKYARIVEVGTQSRSAPYLYEAKKYLDAGRLVKVHLCRVYNMKQLPNFRMGSDSDPPAGFDWEMWNGPAPQQRYNAAFPASWHGFWRYSGGDIINDGIHQIDIARWLCGLRYPRRVSCTGARYDRAGANETPDTLVATLEFDDMLMTLEQTLYTPYMIKSDMVVRDGEIYPYWPQNTERIELYGEKGVMYVGRVGSGWQVFGRQKDRQPVIVAQMHGRYPDAAHQDNFLGCVRSRQRPNADIEEGHLSALLPQFATISYRLGGPKLTVDPQTESFVNSPEGNALLKREYRKPWVVPEQV